MTTAHIINEIARIRTNNNELWMKILHIAARYAPAETASVLSSITTNDAAITSLASRLANDLKEQERDGVLHDKKPKRR